MKIEKVEYSQLKPEDRVLIEMNERFAEYIVLEIAPPYIKWELAHNEQEMWDDITYLKKKKVKLIGRLCSEQK